MRYLIFFIIFVISGVPLFSSPWVFGGAPAYALGIRIEQIPWTPKEFRQGEVLVAFKDNPSHVALLKIPQESDVLTAVAALRKNPSVFHAEPNYRIHRAAIEVAPNDQLYTSQRYLEQINVPAAWARTTGSAKTIVALLDSGVHSEHPDLKKNIWINDEETPSDGIDNDKNGYVDDINGWDFINDIPDANPKFGGLFSDAGVHHGTLLAGIIAAEGNNKIGVAGVSWRTKILPLRVLNNRGEGDILTVVKALDYLLNKKVDVVNLSFVGDGDSAFLREALRRVYDSGAVIVAASGNDETNKHGFDLDASRLYPACYHFSDFSVVSVAALDASRQKANFSNYGRCIDIAAPGVDITTTQVVRYEQPGFTKFYGGNWSGSSLSAAIVSGVVALVRSVYSDATPSEVIEILKSSCTPIEEMNTDFKGKLGCGQVDAGGAVQQAIEKVQSATTVIPVEETRAAQLLLIAPSDGSQPLAAYTKEGIRDVERQLRPFASSRLGYSLTSAPDGSFIVVAAGTRGSPQVRIFNRDFEPLGQFYAYEHSFRGGVSVGVGDIDGDGIDDIVTVPGHGRQPHIKIFTLSGTLKKSFLAYDANFRGGLRLALGDMNADGRTEIAIAPIRGKSEVKIFDGTGTVVDRLAPYTNGASGVSLAFGDIDGDGDLEIVTAPASGSGPIKIFSSVGVLRQAFFPFGEKFRGGVSLALGDLEQNGRDVIVAAPAAGGGPHVRIFRDDGAVVNQFFAFDHGFRKGIILSTLR